MCFCDVGPALWATAHMIWANVRQVRRSEGLVPSIENTMEGSSCTARTCGWNAIHSGVKIRTGTAAPAGTDIYSAITRVRALPSGRAGNAVRINVTKDRLLENRVRVLFCVRWTSGRQIGQLALHPPVGVVDRKPQATGSCTSSRSACAACPVSGFQI